MSKPLFALGNLLVTPRVRDFLSQGEAMDIIRLHSQGEWGELSEEDKKENDLFVKEGHRILSSYRVRGKTIWVITEADRSVTTLLFPEEY